MSLLKEKLAAQVPVLRDKMQNLVKNYGKKSVSDVSVEQVLGGLRGVKSLICNTSEVFIDQGLVIRGIPIADLTEKLPEEILWLLMTGDLPNKTELEDLQEDLKKRSEVPEYIWKSLETIYAGSSHHPMAILISLLGLLEHESKFAKKYADGMKRDEYWQYALEDSLDLIAKIPAIAAGIYRIRFNKGPIVKTKQTLDWGADFARKLGIEKNKDEFANLMRLYMVIHCDHESGNVSAHTSHTIGSALSDPYFAVLGGLAGLAGPLHGLANQECAKFVIHVIDKFKGVPDDSALTEYVRETLSSGRVIPGYGHAVLRVTDPRFTAFIDYGKKALSHDPYFQVVEKLFDIVPKVLMEQGKAKDPWPNVDAASGSILYHFGMVEMEYYTVLFGVSRSLGLCSQMVTDRIMGLPITRPKSVTLDWLVKTVQNQ